MLTYQALCQVPVIFPALTGLTRDEFDRLGAGFTAVRDRLRATSEWTGRGSPADPTDGSGR